MSEQILDTLSAIDVERALDTASNLEQELARVVTAFEEARAKISQLDREINNPRKDDAEALAASLLAGRPFDEPNLVELKAERERYWMALRGLKTRESEILLKLQAAKRDRAKLVGDAVQPLVDELAETASDAVELLCRIATTANNLGLVNGSAGALGRQLEPFRFPFIHARLGRDLEGMQRDMEERERLLEIARHPAVKALAPALARLDEEQPAATPV